MPVPDSILSLKDKNLSCLAVDRYGYLWVGDSTDAEIVIINPTDNSIVANINTNLGPQYIAFATVLPGDCNGDGTVSIDEVQKAINCFLAIQNTCCDKSDLNNNGQVRIDEVQKVINAFLGK